MLELADLLHELVADRGPHALGRVHARGRRALLALILEGAAQDRGRDRLGVRGRVRDDEVLAACLADDARIAPVVGDVRADRLPHGLEDRGRAGEVHAGEVRARERRVADVLAGAVDEVDDPVRQAGLLEDPHRVVRGEHRRRGGLPEHGIAHQRGRAGEVAADRGEVERRDGEDEALERPVFHPVPDARARRRLLLVHPRHEGGVETPEVDQLARRVDLRLVHGLRLAEHRGRVQRVAPRARQELRSAEEDRRALLPRDAMPVLPCLGRRLDRSLDLLGAALVHVGEDMLLVVRHDRLLQVARRDVLAADDERDLDALVPHLLQSELEARALRAAGRVVANGLVHGRGNTEDPGCAHAGHSMVA